MTMFNAAIALYTAIALPGIDITANEIRETLIDILPPQNEDIGNG
jgi:hypothetical protein